MCRDFRKMGAGNIRVHSYVEQRLYCMTCLHTFSADKGAFFETLRSEREALLDVLAALGERNSVRALERLKHHSPNTILHWLDLAGQHLAAVSAELIHDVRLRQAQVDELWTFVKKKQAHCQPTDPPDVGDRWIWRAIALPSRLRVVSYLSQERSEVEATEFLAQFKARTAGRAPLFTSDKLPAYVKALIANYSTPEPPPLKRGRGRPRKEPKRILDSALCYAQVDKRRVGGRVVEVRRRIVFGSAEDIAAILEADGCGSQINTAYVERDNLTSRQSNGRLVRKTLSHSKKVHFLQRQIALEDAIYNFVRPHSALRVKLPRPGAYGRKWEPRTPAMAAGLTDHIWTLEELLSYRLSPPKC
jgi:DNA-binding transcriptional ArsR family regulator